MDLISFVNDAVVYAERYGKEQALSEFANQSGTFTKGDLYIWAYDFDGINLAHPWHPEYRGFNKLSLTDSTGFRMIEAMRDTALTGSGFITYTFENPSTGKIEAKLAYVKQVDDSWWLASGIYGKGFTIPDQAPESIQTYLITRVDDALSYTRNVGREKALETFNNKSGMFFSNGSYIFAFDMNGTTLALPAYPERIGLPEGNITDPNGVSIGKEKLSVARLGEGYWYYVFYNPEAGNVSQLKISYLSTEDNNLVIGTGIYLPEINTSFSQDRITDLRYLVDTASVYIQEVGEVTALTEFNDPNGTFSHPDAFIFVFDSDGVLLANPYLPGLVGKQRIQDKDPYGKYPVRQMIENAKSGGGFTYYFFADPGSDYKIRLKLAYTRLARDNLIVGAGIFPDQ